MRLKSIKLAGFKSFVDPTTVPFPTNMTSIVGPNGCGKSNIIDAVRWVMGESSAKHLRGESMTDVIFNGSTQRQAIGQASIELLFDNHAASLSGEYAAFSEISIRRKVTREGVSQYYLNGSKCRRRDVTDIFLGTGMGPRSYAIIEQGMISRLIESKPEELRVYLEEAAGISKYKERRRETENRMKRTRENLERLSDIRDELGKQLSSLKRQASAAERYAEYKQSEREMSARLRALSWDKHERVRVSLVDDVRQCEQQVEDFVLEKTAGLSRIESNRTVLEEKQAEFNRLQAKFYQTGAEIAKLEQQLKFEKEKLERRAAEASRARDEELRLKERFSAQQSELAELDDTLFELQPELEMLREHELLIGDELAGQEDNFRTWLTSSELFQQQSSDARSLAERKQSAVQQSEQSINTMTDRLVRIQNERSLLEGEMQGFDFEYIASQLEHALVSLSDNAEALQLLEGRAEVDEAHYDHLESELSHHSSSLSEKKAISAALETLQKSALNASSESKGSAEQAEFEKYLDSSAASRLFDCIHVESGWGVALETVLRDYLRGYVIDQPNFSDLEVFLEQHWSIIDGGWAADEAPIKGR
jgi:chromosome segregation ATPase